MKIYEQNQLRNVVLIGAPRSGKTTLAEAMLFEGGMIKRRGSVEEKSSVSDYHEVEQERGNSIYSTFMHAEWRDCKINILDTPGLDDFVGEIYSSFRVADTAVLVLSAHHGFEVGTEILWGRIEKYKKPTLLLINQLDHPKANYELSVESVQKRFGTNAVIVQYPLIDGEQFDTIIDVLKMRMYKFPLDGGKPEKHPIPENEMVRAQEFRNILIEKAAENEESLIEEYFETGNLIEADFIKGIKLGFAKQDLMPIFCSSAKKNMGVGRIMGFLNSVAPDPHEKVTGELTIDNLDIKCDVKASPTLFIFKTLVEPYLGKVNFFKVCSGEIKVGTELINAKTGDHEKVHQILVMDGKNRHVVDRMVAGDIGAFVKLKSTLTNHTLRTKDSAIEYKPMVFPEPKIQMAIVAENKNDDEKMVICLREIHDEDPTFHFEYSRELKQLLVMGQGELHLEISRWRLDHLYQIKTHFEKPKIPYRETILKESSSMYRHKKQSGGAGQFGEVHIKILPYKEGMGDPEGFSLKKKEVIELPWGGKLIFYNAIVGGVIDQRFVPAVLKGILEKMEEGPITGSHARDVCVILHDGKMHSVDSNDISFKIAGTMAFKEGFLNAAPLLLEPIYDLEVLVPEELVGDVMADLQSRRSIIQGVDSANHFQIIKAKTPLSELYKYSTALKSMTQGRAGFSCKFTEYSTIPGEIQKKLAEEYSTSKAAHNHH